MRTNSSHLSAKPGAGGPPLDQSPYRIQAQPQGEADAADSTDGDFQGLRTAVPRDELPAPRPHCPQRSRHWEAPVSGTSDTTCELPVGPRGLCPRSLTHAASWSCLPLVSCLLVLLRVCFLESFSTGGAARLMTPGGPRWPWATNACAQRVALGLCWGGCFPQSSVADCYF